MTHGFPGQASSPWRGKEVKKNPAEERESVMTNDIVAARLIFATTESDTRINEA